MSLVYKWDILKKVTHEKEGDSTERKEARADLTKVLDFVQSSKGLDAYFKNRESHQSSQVIEFEYLWTIFSTGTEVIALTFMEEKQVMIVSAPPYDYDVHKRIFRIDRYYGTKKINTLPCYPLDSHKKDTSSTGLEDLKVKYTTRGERFKDLCQAKPGVKQMFHYDGQGLIVESKQNNNENAVDGSIQVDPLSYLEQAISNGKKALTYLTAPLGGEDLWLGEEEIYISPIKEMRCDISEEKKFLLAPPRVLGWSSSHNHWCQFRVDEVKEAKKAKEAIFDKELQLELKVKNMITALVTQHNSQEGGKGVQNPDLIEGKGRGLVIMLHGPPGVGKTLTAEAIAEKTSRPLLIVSVAQIGLNASKAERNLERMFELASRWEAVLLVDEADVFLETRDTQANPNRNALVSVLLRVLEYYQGIIILTTNRIKSLDAAVQSRIHLAVRFDELTQPQMQSILRTILRKFNVKDSEIEDITDNFQNYLADSPRFKLNGREIRNVVFSAHAVALSEGKESIGWNHIRDVLRLTRDFQDQLKAITDKQRYGREAAKGAE
ncbi:MAG: hypothetical protein Q9215_006415 [Flavoplaca cf. flavocitrina]